MKKLLFPIVLLTALAVSSYAQMTKTEEKEWAKKLKTLTPAGYKQLLEEKEALATEINTLKTQNADLQTKLSTKDAEIAALNKQLTDAQAAQKAQVTPGGKGTAVNGLVFKVQIGAFRDKDLSKYFENNKNFSGEIDADGTKKYTLGNFAEYWEAENFKKYLREMGVKDAWIVAYKDGKRVDIKDALEGAL